MKITTELLRRHGAYCDQLTIFERLWPDGCEPTAENAAKALAAELDITWCARLLSPAALERYYAETAAAWARYEADIAPMWARYSAEIAAARARYDADIAAARARYRAEVAASGARHDAEVASALVRAFATMEGS